MQNKQKDGMQVGKQQDKHNVRQNDIIEARGETESTSTACGSFEFAETWQFDLAGALLSHALAVWPTHLLVETRGVLAVSWVEL